MDRKTKKICLDIETTGVDIDSEVLQLSIIDGDFNVLFNKYIKPTRATSWSEAMRINAITPEMVANEKPIVAYKAEIEAIINSADLIITYNGDGFDLPFLAREGINIDIAIDTYDVMLAFAYIYGEWNDCYDCYRWQKLSVCADFLGVINENAHDSLGDVIATMKCYQKICEIYKNQDKLLDQNGELDRVKIREFCKRGYK